MERGTVRARSGAVAAVIGALAVLPAPAALAQQAPRLQPRVQPQLDPVEPGLQDLGPTVLGRRDLRRDLREPLGFDRVYRLRTRDPFSVDGANDVFVRRSGGVTAVFPRSTYRPGPFGPEAEIPPGTVFYVGPLPAELTGAGEPAPLPEERLNLRAARGAIRWTAPRAESLNDSAPPVELPPDAAAADAEPFVLSVFEDETYRQRRISALLARAARAR